MLILFIEPEDIKQMMHEVFFKTAAKKKQRRKRHAIPPKEDLLNHYADRKTYSQIAKIYHVSVTTVCRWFKKINNPSRVLRVIETTNIENLKFGATS
jgi:DNA invertase Pin-like site-specific DNA recombinase